MRVGEAGGELDLAQEPIGPDGGREVGRSTLRPPYGRGEESWARNTTAIRPHRALARGDTGRRGALGCREALLLDGISGQLLLRDADGASRVWSGIRRDRSARGRPVSASP